MEMLESVAIYWKGMPINLQCIPNVSYSFETFANTFFTFDYLPRDVLNMMEAIDKIPLPENGTEDERIDWLIERGGTIQQYNTEWRATKEANERMRLSTEEAQEYLQDIYAEADDLRETRNMSLKKIHDHLMMEHAEDELKEMIPENYNTFSSGYYRYVRKGKGD